MQNLILDCSSKIISYLSLNDIIKLMLSNKTIMNNLLHIITNYSVSINFTGCNKITDIVLQYLQGVHTINLAWCKNITD